MISCFQANILAVKATGHRSFNLAHVWGPWMLVWAVSLSPSDISARRLTPGNRVRAFGVRQDLTGGEALASYR